MKKIIKNIGLFNDCFPPVMDGVSVCVYNYAKWMQKKVSGVSVITPNVPGTDYSKYDFEVMDYFSVPVPFRHPYVTGIAEIDPAFINKVITRHFKLVHAHCPFGSGMAAHRVARMNGIPCIATFHSKYRDDFSRVIPSKKIVDVISGSLSPTRCESTKPASKHQRPWFAAGKTLWTKYLTATTHS